MVEHRSEETEAERLSSRTYPDAKWVRVCAAKGIMALTSGDDMYVDICVQYVGQLQAATKDVLSSLG